MEVFIAIVTIGVIIYFATKSSNKSGGADQTKFSKEKVEFPFEIKVTTSYSHSKEETFDPIRQTDEGNWILNPGAPFELTLLTNDQQLANSVRALLDDNQTRDYNKRDVLTGILIENRLTIKEVEDYITNYSKIYKDKIKELIRDSSEWSKVGEKDKEDMLKEFRLDAEKVLFERANCDLSTLLEERPQHNPSTDSLISEAGFKNIETYMMYSDKLDKIRIIPSDHYSRNMFENLVKLDMAAKGAELSKEEILLTLTLKELNDIAKHPEQEFKRKNRAVEYILTLDSVDELIGKHVALRELFKLKKLPKKYQEVDFDNLERLRKFYKQVCLLLIDTYSNSLHSWQDVKNNEGVKNYRIETFDRENSCPCALELSMKKFPKGKPPQVPCHVGCNCYLRKEYDWN